MKRPACKGISARKKLVPRRCRGFPEPCEPLLRGYQVSGSVSMLLRAGRVRGAARGRLEDLRARGEPLAEAIENRWIEGGHATIIRTAAEPA